MSIQKKKPFCQNYMTVQKVLLKYSLFLIVVIGMTISGQQKLNAQGLSDREKAQWILVNIAQNTIWTNEASIRNYTIAVFGYSGVYNELEKLSGSNLIKGKSFQSNTI